MSNKIDNDVLMLPWDSRLMMGMGYHFQSGEVRGMALKSKEGEEIASATKVVPFGNQTLPRDENVPEQIHSMISDSWTEAAGARKDKKEYFGNVYAPHSFVDYSLKFIDSSKEIRDTMDISGEITFSNKMVDATASASFSKKDINTSNTVYYLITVKVRTYTERLDPEKLQLAEVGKTVIGGVEGRDKFEERFGDGFVSGVVYGGEMNALLEISAKEGEDTMDIKAEASLKYGKANPAMDITAEAKFEMSVGNITKGRNVNITATVTGGTLVRIPAQPEEFLVAANEFIHSLVSPTGNPVPVRVLITPYRHLQDWVGMGMSQYVSGALIQILVDIFLEFQTTAQSVLARQKRVLALGDNIKDPKNSKVGSSKSSPASAETIIMRLHYLLDFCVRSQIRIGAAVKKQVGPHITTTNVPALTLEMFNQVVNYTAPSSGGDLKGLPLVLEEAEGSTLQTLMDIVPVPPAYIRMLLDDLVKLPTMKNPLKEK
mmetsp:Transcript_47900/g.153503  ORF Transcript_47900/g.153503 Transcript_47900/m.153503 type:complete len:488 (+) Transcript_47900:272-1735(+)|eukprot:CAMPEP_0182852252 /NCGR_PEP_ID=MMETSP0034_2-20130328/63_1 /TAXON_ID=156128 /ORGANISM="Nephroselmis pyriformis, Strain CCMP717" /LENGTH=487 /DNA_ID=CAMNT_0024982955 /DNA_START=272 /DNA_END=1735 /DNA_ORIENTATION=-